MRSKPHHSGINTAAVLPADSAARFSSLLERAGYALVALEAEPAVVVIDFSHPEGAAALAALLEEPQFGELARLAVVGDSYQDAERALDGGADGFVAVSSLEREFDLRLRAVRKLATSRIEQARREKDLAVLLELTARYASALDVATLLHDVTRRLAEELSIDRCALVVLEGERRVGHIVAASDDHTLHDVRIDLELYPEIIEVMRTGKPVVVQDVASHPLLDPVKEVVARRGIAALAAVPLAVQNKILGVLLLRASEGSGFEPHEINFAWTVAHATAIALRNARMLEGLKGKAEKAEAQVAQLAQYEDFFQYSSDGLLILDETGAIASINPAGAQTIDIDADKARGKMLVSLTNPLSEGALMEMLTAVRRGLAVRNVDLDFTTPGGRVVTLSASGSSLSGGPSVIMSVRDVTAARATERELLKTKEFLEKLINSSVDAIVAADLDGNVIIYNQSAERILGWTQAEAVGGLNLNRLHPDGMLAGVMNTLRSGVRGGPGRLEPTRLELEARDGERIPVLLSAALIREGDQPVAMVSIFSDLRERTRLEARLSLAQEQLEAAEKQALLVELAGTAAHELNQPLTSVMGYSEMLKHRLKSGDPSLRSVEIIYREAERMAEIVRKIGKITRYETKAYVGDRRIVDLDRASGEEE